MVGGGGDVDGDAAVWRFGVVHDGDGAVGSRGYHREPVVGAVGGIDGPGGLEAAPGVRGAGEAELAGRPVEGDAGEIKIGRADGGVGGSAAGTR